MGSKEGSRGSVEAQLIDMGFDSSLVARAVEKQPTLQRATEWILQNQHSLARARRARENARPTTLACAHPAARARRPQRPQAEPAGRSGEPAAAAAAQNGGAPAASAEGKVVRILAGPRKGEEGARAAHGQRLGAAAALRRRADQPAVGTRGRDLRRERLAPRRRRAPQAELDAERRRRRRGAARDRREARTRLKRLLAHVPPPSRPPPRSAAAAPADGGVGLPADDVAAAPPAPPDGGDSDA